MWEYRRQAVHQPWRLPSCTLRRVECDLCGDLDTPKKWLVVAPVTPLPSPRILLLDQAGYRLERRPKQCCTKTLGSISWHRQAYEGALDQGNPSGAKENGCGVACPARLSRDILTPPSYRPSRRTNPAHILNWRFNGRPKDHCILQAFATSRRSILGERERRCAATKTSSTVATMTSNNEASSSRMTLDHGLPTSSSSTTTFSSHYAPMMISGSGTGTGTTTSSTPSRSNTSAGRTAGGEGTFDLPPMPVPYEGELFLLSSRRIKKTLTYSPSRLNRLPILPQPP